MGYLLTETICHDKKTGGQNKLENTHAQPNKLTDRISNTKM